MTIKMPSLDGLPSIITDERGSTGVFPILRRPLRVQYSADTVDVTLPDHVAPIPYDGGDGQLDEVLNRHVLFTDTEGNFWSIEQSRLQFLQTLSATFYVMFRRTARGWKRWQPRLGPPAPPTTPTKWLIALIAGGTTQADLFGTHAVDGALGINTMYGPQVMAFDASGVLWFLDGTGTEIRTYDPATGLVATKFGINNALSAPTELGLAIDSSGNVWISYQIDADSPFAIMQVYTSDGLTLLGGAGSSAVGGPLGGVPTTIGLSPDGTRLYYAFGRTGGAGLFYLDVATVLSGEFVSSTNSLADVPGQTVGCFVDSDGNVYSVSWDEGGAVRVTPDGVVTNLTNIASGLGFSGDGLPAFTEGDDTPQLNNAAAIAYDPVSNTIAIVDRNNFVIRAIDSAGLLQTIAGIPLFSGGGLGNYPTSIPADARRKYLGGSVNSIVPIGNGMAGFYVCVGSDYDESGVDGIWAIYKLYPGSFVCLSTTPTIRLVAGGQPSDEDGHQIDGALGTNSVEGITQMCWGPDGLLWFGGDGSSVDFTTNVRTYDPITGLVATTPFHSTFGDRGRINGICCSAAGNVYFIVNSTDDEDTTYLCKIPFGATSQSDVTEIFFFSTFGGSASLMRNLGVVTNPDGKEFVIVEHTSFAQIYYVDVTEETLSDSIMGDPGYGSVDADNPEMGEDVDGTAGSIGDTTKGMYVTSSGQIVTSSSNNQVIRTGQAFFEDDGDGGTVPQVFHLQSVTSHSLYPSGDPAGYGGDEEPALVPGDYGPRFNGLTAVAVDQCGNYYTIDYNNNVLRMVDALGILHTIAGNGLGAFDMGATFATADPVLATTVSLGIDVTTGGALLPDPAGGLYLASNNALYKLESFTPPPPPSPTVWVVNYGSDTVSVFSMDGVFLGSFSDSTIVGSLGGCTVGSETWIANNGFSSVSRFDVNGNNLGVITGGALANPQQIWPAPGANIWAINGSGSGSVGQITTSGSVVGFTFTPPSFNGPYGVTFVRDSSGNALMWITNSSNNTITVLIVGSGFTGSALTPGGLSTPYGLAQMTDTNVWVANGGNDTISRLTQDGVAIDVLSGNGLSEPRGITQVGMQVWVPNRTGDTISRFNLDGTAIDTITASTVIGPVTAIVVDGASAPIWS